MHNASSAIGALAAALAKAQSELINPEKSATAQLRSAFPGENTRLFRYAPLSAGLEIVRKTLSSHDLAIVQATQINGDGYVSLTTILAHSSGEWISSDWPVCSHSEPPAAMGSALTYARRYALFALVGISGEDDLDAPQGSAAPSQERQGSSAIKPAPKSPERHRASVLDAASSGDMRNRIMADFAELTSEAELARCAYSHMKLKNRLTEADATAVEQAFRQKMESLTNPADSAAAAETAPSVSFSPTSTSSQTQSERCTPIIRPTRRRSKTHLRFVASHPCLICEKTPADAHHVKFAQASALGRKVSDEFTVPLCRAHHNELHRHGDERAFWSNLRINPIDAAKALWARSSGANMRQAAPAASTMP